jgi:hypothetical protein
MEYRRRYFRRFGNQNQEDKSQNNNPTQNKIEEKVEPQKNETKVNTQNTYLQKILQNKNNVQNPSTINIGNVKDTLPSFKNNIHDILSTDENKQRAIKYVMQKRNEGKRGKFQINTDNGPEESNPALASRYTYYHNKNKINQNNQNGEIYNKYTNVNTNNNLKKGEIQLDIKPPFSRYYARRTMKTQNNKEQEQEQINNNFENNFEDNLKREISYRSGKIKNSISSNNMLTSPKNCPPFENDEKLVVKKEKNYDMNSYRNNNANNIKEKEEIKPRYKYAGGNNKRFEFDKKEKEENINEKENENENINKLKEISINLSVGKNFSFGIKDILSNKSFGNQSSGEILNSFDDSNKFKGYKNFKIVKNNFELRQKYKKDVYTKKYGFSRQKEKLADNKKEIIQDKVIEIKLLGIKTNNTNVNTNSEVPVSRFRRKYGRYTSNLENKIDNQNEQNLTFKDENELISHLNKKYEQNKILDLFNISLEDTKNKKDKNIPLEQYSDIKQLQEQLNGEKRKNEENEKKIKQLESNITEQTNEIRDKQIGIGKKIQEIDKLKNDITSYKKDLQSKEKENIRLKNELEQKIKTEENKQNKLKEEYEKIKSNYDSLIKENDKNVKDYNELLNENEQNKNDYNELLKDFESLKNQSAELTEIKKTKDELDSNYNKINDENILLKQEIDTIKKDYELNISELNKYKTENEKLKGEMNIMNNLNDKLIEDNGKIKEEIQNKESDLEKNKQQNQELNKTKEKYYKLLDDYKQLTEDCNIIRDEKALVQLEQKQLRNENKIYQEENIKLKNDYIQLKNDYDYLVKELNNFKNKENQEIPPKSILKKQENQIKEINKNIQDIKNEENPMIKSLTIETTKRLNIDLDDKDTQKVNDINSVISDVSNNINDLINKINTNESINNSDKKEQKDSNVKFNIKEEDDNNLNDTEKNKIDEEKKNFRLSKAMLRIKKKQEKINNNNDDNNQQLKFKKSLKVQNLVKELENNMQKRDMIEGEKEEINGGNEVQIENGANVVNILENQQLTKSIKKKKTAKQFDEEEN